MKINLEDLEKETNYLARVFCCNSADIFTEKEIELAQKQGFIEIE